MKTAVVLGSAVSAMLELEEVCSRMEPDEIFAVNAMIHLCPLPLIAVTLHPEHYSTWQMKRVRNGFGRPKEVVIQEDWREWLFILGRHTRLSYTPSREASQQFPGQKASGSSGLFATKVALEDYGFDRVILCGVPMETESCHIDNPMVPWRGANRHRKGWEEAREHLIGRVRSMSGWTSQFLGDARGWL